MHPAIIELHHRQATGHAAPGAVWGDNVPMGRTRRFHLEFPTVVTTVAGRQVRFVGATFHSRSVMIEYDVEPPSDRREGSFGPEVLMLVVTDDTDPTPYPTQWEDFDWSFLKAGRMTTRLDRRPRPNATRLNVSVRTPHIVTTSDGAARYTASDEEVVAFKIDLPEDHASKPLRQIGG